MLRILLLCFCLYPLTGWTIDPLHQLDSLASLTNDSFLLKCPYEQYVANYSMKDVRRLETFRLYVNELGQAGDYFIMNLFGYYLSHQKLNFHEPDSITKYIRLAELMANSKYYYPDSVFVYEAVSDLIFETIATQLKEGINSKKLDREAPAIKYLINRLGENQFFIDFPTSNFKKMWKHLVEGNFKYLYLKATTTYWKQALLILTLGCSLFGGLVYLWWRRKKNKKT